MPKHNHASQHSTPLLRLQSNTTQDGLSASGHHSRRHYQAVQRGLRFGLASKPVISRKFCVLQADVYIFFCQIYKMWVECGLYPELSVEDVKDEVFDMAQPKHPLHITSHDLQVTACIACAEFSLEMLFQGSDVQPRFLIGHCWPPGRSPEP